MKYSRSNKEREAWYYSYLLTHDTAFKEVKSYNLKDYFIEKYKTISSLFIKQENTIEKYKTILNLIIGLIQDLFSLFIMVVAISGAYAGEIMIGTVMAYLNAITMIETSTNTVAAGIYSIYNSNLYMRMLGKTAVSTLKDRARIKGTALMDVKKSVLADILNECLQVAKGDALLRISEGKVRGVLSGDEADYAIISMPKLFMVASAYISGDRNGEFIYGYADHNMAQITWKIVDQKMTKAYADLMEEHGKKPFGNLQTFIRIVSSDVGASGANIFYSILDGDFTIVLGEALRTKHRHKQGLEEFSENMESIFQYYKQKLRDIGKLCDIRIRYPVNALSEVMKKQSFGKKLIAETVERFKTNFGEQPCSAYEIYCGLCEALFFARKSGSSPSNLVKMEEKIARCMNVRWHDYDIPGEISL